MKHFSRRTFIKNGLVLGVSVGLGLSLTQPETDSHLPLEGGKRVHDPVLIKENDTYYLFCTGQGIPVRTSKD
jgi:hypothetical protein